MRTAIRVLLTIAVLLAWSYFEGFVNIVSPLVSGPAAGLQFDNSNLSYLAANLGMRFSPVVNTLIDFGAIGMLLVLWLGPARRFFVAMAAVMMVCLLVPHPAWAFFDTANKTEAYNILPSETAFWIPSYGNNKTTQAKLDSEDYYNNFKVAMKLFVISHHKLTGTGGTSWLSGWDDYVPDGRLIIVDRKPYSREWVDATDRGTAAAKQGFPCQSSEGLNITVGVSVGVTVDEDNAAKYLANFGVEPPKGERTDPQVIFTSVYYGRPVESVMDDVGRKEVQTLVCGFISSMPFDQVNANATNIMNGVRKQASDFFATVGITLKFLGWADTFTFDKEVQDAVNRRYIAAQDEHIASLLQPYAGTIQELAAAQALRSWGEKADGKLPATIVGLPTSVGGLLGSLMGVHGNAPVPVQEPAAAAPAYPPHH